MAIPPIPLINGNHFDFASIIIKTDFGSHEGVTAISYTDSVERSKVYGTNRKIIGRTGGQASHEGSFTMIKSHYQDLISRLGNRARGIGYGETPFDVIISYAEPGQPVITDTLVGCKIDSSADSHSEGTDALTVDCDLNIFDILRNGVSIIEKKRG